MMLVNGRKQLVEKTEILWLESSTILTKTNKEPLRVGGVDILVPGQLADKPNRGQPTRGLVNSRTPAYSVGVRELTSPRMGCPRFGLSAS